MSWGYLISKLEVWSNMRKTLSRSSLCFRGRIKNASSKIDNLFRIYRGCREILRALWQLMRSIRCRLNSLKIGRISIMNWPKNTEKNLKKSSSSVRESRSKRNSSCDKFRRPSHSPSKM
jgi:hypothetical protein